MQQTRTGERKKQGRLLQFCPYTASEASIRYVSVIGAKARGVMQTMGLSASFRCVSLWGTHIAPCKSLQLSPTFFLMTRTGHLLRMDGVFSSCSEDHETRTLGTGGSMLMCQVDSRQFKQIGRDFR